MLICLPQCGHAGPCIERPDDDRHSCHCASSDILCESFCGCPDDCPRRFTGCPCESNGVPCSTETCICIRMNRECGPECGSCGALERVNPINKYNDELFTTGCRNVSLQRGVSKATVIGESQLVGFGLYLAEPVKKGDYISEYTGEVSRSYSVLAGLLASSNPMAEHFLRRSRSPRDRLRPQAPLFPLRPQP